MARAGHLEPVLLRDRDAAPWPVEGTIPLFIDDLPPVQVCDHALRPGDKIVFFTDGVTDVVSPGGESYPAARLAEVLRRHADLAPRDLLARLVADAARDSVVQRTGVLVGETEAREDAQALAVRMRLNTEFEFMNCETPRPDAKLAGVLGAPAAAARTASIRSNVNPFSASVVRAPPQSPESRGRVQKSPE